MTEVGGEWLQQRAKEVGGELDISYLGMFLGR